VRRLLRQVINWSVFLNPRYPTQVIYWSVFFVVCTSSGGVILGVGAFSDKFLKSGLLRVRGPPPLSWTTTPQLDPSRNPNPYPNPNPNPNPSLKSSYSLDCCRS
jgi:hypothetical protein